MLLNGAQLVTIDLILQKLWNEYEKKSKDEKINSYSIRNQNMQIEFGFSSVKRSQKYYDGINNTFYMMLFQIPNSGTGAAEGMLYYAFEGRNISTDNNTYYINYDEETGATEKTKTIHSQFIAFKNLIHVLAVNGPGMTPNAVADRLHSNFNIMNDGIVKARNSIENLDLKIGNVFGGSNENNQFQPSGIPIQPNSRRMRDVSKPLSGFGTRRISSTSLPNDGIEQELAVPAKRPKRNADTDAFNDEIMEQDIDMLLDGEEDE